MYNEKIEKLTTVVERVNVDEKAYLMVTKSGIGVTDSLEDVFAYIKNQTENGEFIKILSGYKEELLLFENRMILWDEVCRSVNSDSVAIPQKFTDYNLLQRRECNNNPLFKALCHHPGW